VLSGHIDTVRSCEQPPAAPPRRQTFCTGWRRCDNTVRGGRLISPAASLPDAEPRVNLVFYDGEESSRTQGAAAALQRLGRSLLLAFAMQLGLNTASDAMAPPGQ